MALRSWKFGLAAGIACVLTASSQAGLLPLSSTVVPDGGNFRFTYRGMLASNPPLPKGDVFVIYHFNGFKPGTNDQPAGFQFSTMNVGGNPGRTIPNDNDSM